MHEDLGMGLSLLERELRHEALILDEPRELRDITPRILGNNERHAQ